MWRVQAVKSALLPSPHPLHLPLPVTVTSRNLVSSNQLPRALVKGLCHCILTFVWSLHNRWETLKWLFFWAGLGTGYLWSTGAVVAGCPSWHRQWPWWDLNIGLLDHEPQVLSTEPYLLLLNICVMACQPLILSSENVPIGDLMWG